MQWSEQQQAIFQWFETGKGNLVIRARAGTGKTTTILEAISHAPEQQIILGAFNKKIALELQSRLKNPKAKAQTFHSLGYSAIMYNWKGCVLDNDRAERLVRRVSPNNIPDSVVSMIKKMSALGKNICPYPNMDRMLEISYQFDVDPSEELINEGWNIHTICQLAMNTMSVACEKDGTFDFDDMIFVPLRNSWIRPRFDLVVIDEAQDMNTSQLLMAQRLSKGRIVVVGDDKQAIYGFRGADSNSIDRLKGELIANELGLTITYRCPKQVVQHINWIVPDFKAADEAPEGLVKVLAYDKMLVEVDAGDFILSRKNAPLSRTCFKLLALNKKVVIEGREIGKGIQKIVKSLKAKDIPELIEKIYIWQDKQLEKLSKVDNKFVEGKIENIKDQAEIIKVFAENSETIDELVLKLEVMFQQTDNGKLDCIVCSSVHRAKGLERNRVFGLSDTLYPGGNQKSIEEQNIEYVMVTRAKKEFIRVVGLI